LRHFSTRKKGTGCNNQLYHSDTDIFWIDNVCRQRDQNPIEIQWNRFQFLAADNDGKTANLSDLKHVQRADFQHDARPTAKKH